MSAAVEPRRARGGGGEGAPPGLSIVLVSWNTRDVLLACLASLQEHTRGVVYEVVVVDNASTDGTPEAVRARFPGTRVLENDTNLGFAAACNQGMAAAEADLILLLNSDTYVQDDAIGTMVAFMRSEPDIAMSGCRIHDATGRLQNTACRPLSLRLALFEDLWLHRLVPSRIRNEMLLGGFWQPDRIMDVDWLAGVFMLLRRETFTSSGGFDEDFFMYGEDSEWCLRLRRAGARIVYNPHAVVYHLGSVSSDLRWTSRDRLRLCHLGGVEAYAKLHGRWRAAAYAAGMALGSTVRWVAYALLSVVSPKPYYRVQRDLRGGRARDYAEGLWRMATGGRKR